MSSYGYASGSAMEGGLRRNEAMLASTSAGMSGLALAPTMTSTPTFGRAPPRSRVKVHFSPFFDVVTG